MACVYGNESARHTVHNPPPTSAAHRAEWDGLGAKTLEISELSHLYRPFFFSSTLRHG